MGSGPPSIEEQRALVAGWAEAGSALAAERHRALAAGTDAEFREASLDLLRLAERLPPDPARDRTSGLVEMQRLFARGRA